MRATEAVQIPAPDPELTAAIARHGEIGREVSDSEAKVRSIEAQLVDADQVRPGEKLTERAAAFLGLKAQGGALGAAKLREDLGAARDHLAVVRRARDLMRDEVDRLRRAWSRRVCRELAPEHRSVVGRIAAALIDLGHAALAERAFVDALESADVSGFGSELRVMPTPMGSPLDTQSSISFWLREARDFGLLEEREIPAEWRREWPPVPVAATPTSAAPVRTAKVRKAQDPAEWTMYA